MLAHSISDMVRTKSDIVFPISLFVRPKGYSPDTAWGAGGVKRCFLYIFSMNVFSIPIIYVILCSMRRRALRSGVQESLSDDSYGRRTRIDCQY